MQFFWAGLASVGIAWIGSSFFFMWLDAGLEKHDQLEEGVEGELFLVHSGGYYKIHKKLFGHGQLQNMVSHPSTDTFFNSFHSIRNIFYDN